MLAPLCMSPDTYLRKVFSAGGQFGHVCPTEHAQHGFHPGLHVIHTRPPSPSCSGTGQHCGGGGACGGSHASCMADPLRCLFQVSEEVADLCIDTTMNDELSLSCPRAMCTKVRAIRTFPCATAFETYLVSMLQCNSVMSCSRIGLESISDLK